MINHLGQDFSTKVKLNMLPGFKLLRGIYQMEIQYVTDIGGNITMHHMTQNMMRETEFEAYIGKDVRHVSVQIHCHNSFPTNPLIAYRYEMRIDRLILLNIAIKFLNKA